VRNFQPGCKACWKPASAFYSEHFRNSFSNFEPQPHVVGGAGLQQQGLDSGAAFLSGQQHRVRLLRLGVNVGTAAAMETFEFSFFAFEISPIAMFPFFQLCNYTLESLFMKHSMKYSLGKKIFIIG
jgi:hypothetical protein